MLRLFSSVPSQISVYFTYFASVMAEVEGNTEQPPTIEELFVSNLYLRKIKELSNCGPRTASHRFPQILNIENGRTQINALRNISSISTVADTEEKAHGLVTSTFKANFVPSLKFKVTSHGDWVVRVAAVHVDTFASRDEFDEACSPAMWRAPGFSRLHLRLNRDWEELQRLSDPDFKYEPIVAREFPIRKAFEAVSVSLGIDVEYLARDGPEELKTKIRERLEWYPFRRKAELERLERIFFYKAMTDLFGKEDHLDDPEVSTQMDSAEAAIAIAYEASGNDENPPVKEYMVSDFKILTFDGNHAEATCRRGNYYLQFCYDTS